MKMKLKKVFKGVAFAMLFLFTVTSTVSLQSIAAVDVKDNSVIEAYDFDVTLDEVDKLNLGRIKLYSFVSYEKEFEIIENTVEKEFGEYKIIFADKENKSIQTEIKVRVIETIEEDVFTKSFLKATSTAQTWINYGYRGSVGYNNPHGQMSIKYADGKLSFCIEPQMLFSVGATYTVNNVSNTQDSTMNEIIYYGYYKNSKTEKNYAFTQIALWNYITTGSISGNNFVMTYGDTSGFSSFLNTLKTNLGNHGKLPSFNGKTYNVNVGEKLFISDANGISNIGNFNSSKVKKVSGGIEVGPFSTSEIGNTKITYKKDFTGYGSNPLLYKSSSSQNIIVPGDPDWLSGIFNVKVIALDSKIELTKTSAESGDVSPGAIFGIYKLNSTTNEFEPYINKNIKQEIDEEVDLEVNDDNEAKVLNVKEDYLFSLEDHHYVSSKGKITLNNVPLGTYALKEIISPEGHVLNDVYIPFKVDGDGATINLDFPNEKIYGSNIIQKTDNRSKTYSGAEVNLMKWNKETENFDFVQKIVTKEYETITLEQWNTIDEKERGKLVDVVIDEEKKIVTIPGAAFVDELEYGKYGYEEIKAPDGTIIYKGVLEFYVTENGVVTTMKLVNLRELTKTGMINASLVLMGMSLLLLIFKKHNKGYTHI